MITTPLTWYHNFQSSGRHYFLVSLTNSVSTSCFHFRFLESYINSLPDLQRFFLEFHQSLLITSKRNPTLFLVSPLLYDKSYHTWSRSTHIILISKKKEKFIDGTLTKPPVADPLYALWIRCNTMVLAWLHRSISKLLPNLCYGLIAPLVSRKICRFIFLIEVNFVFQVFRRIYISFIKVLLIFLTNWLNWKFYGMNWITIVLFLLVLT